MIQYQKNKWKFIIYVVIGIVLLIVIIFAALAGNLEENCEEGNEATTSIEADSKSQKENAKQVYDFLIKNHQATPQGASGVLGNLEQESNLDPSAIENKSNPTSGHGLIQWTDDRTTKLKEFAEKKDKDWDNLGLQLEFLDSELKGAEKGAVEALKEKDVKKATSQWQVLFERAGDPQMGSRLNYANKWYAEFGTNDPVSSETLSNASENDEEALGCSDDDSPDGSGGGDTTKNAKELIGHMSYSQPNRTNLGTARNPDKNGNADCSSFVWLILKKSGYKVPETPYNTVIMVDDAKKDNNYFKQIKPNNAKAGDVVIVNVGGGLGNNGHTAILLEDWHGKDTDIVQIGGVEDKVNKDKFGTSFMSLLSGDTTLARPIEE